MSAETVVQHDHRELDDLMDQVKKALFAGDGGTAISKLDRFWARLAVHIRAEHLHLFPAIQSVAEQTSETGKLIESLREDHNFFMHELAVAIKEMRSITVETESEIIKSVSKIAGLVAKRLARHNDIEESEIYPLVSRLFDSMEQDRLLDGIERELGNLPQRFK
jgi:hemerythrin-like domain-containing protein